jgi:serine/threonine protein kinase
MKGEPVSLSSDVFSYGMLLYEILTGELPFTDAKTDVMVSSQILSGEVRILISVTRYRSFRKTISYVAK